uniref:FLYWCH-type domain-containing protein n=1 Tax=Trichuris muris TaxID=70415 RepID=A0A5S6QYT9_TRIMR
MFAFERLNASQTVKFWRCGRRDSHDCKARIRTSVATNEVVKVVNSHSHGGGADEVEAAAVCTAMVRRAEESMEIPAVILNEQLQGLNVEVKGQLPNMAALRQCPTKTYCYRSGTTISRVWFRYWCQRIMERMAMGNVSCCTTLVWKK